MELKKAITTVPYCSMGGWVFRNRKKKKCGREGKMAKRITEKKGKQRHREPGREGKERKMGKWNVGDGHNVSVRQRR